MTPTQIHFAAAAMLLMLAAPLNVNAHLMVEQRGTINIVDEGAFIVVSVPVAAFPGIDDDGDGLVSAAELRSHYKDISADVQRRLQLRSGAGSLPLEGLLINSAKDHTEEPSAQLVVMGRFALGSEQSELRVRTSLFGRTATERKIQILARRGADSKVLILTPKHPERTLFP
jgi:hypothetical protein